MTVYLIRHPGDDAVKIGYTAGDPQDRLRSMQTGSASPLELVATIPDAPMAVERELHRQFADLRLSGEWFRDRPAIKEAFRDHRAAQHRQHLLDRIHLAREALSVVSDDAAVPTQLLERVIRLGHEAFDETACGCVMPEERREEIVATDLFLQAIVERVVNRWEGTGKELHAILKRPDDVDPKYWPRERGTSCALKRIAPDLRKAGWTVDEVEVHRDETKRGKRAKRWVLVPPDAGSITDAGLIFAKKA